MTTTYGVAAHTVQPSKSSTWPSANANRHCDRQEVLGGAQHADLGWNASARMRKPRDWTAASTATASAAATPKTMSWPGVGERRSLK